MSDSNRWWLRAHGLSISIAFVTTSGLVALAIGWLMGSGAASAGNSPGWTTYTDTDHGFTVSFPSSWERAKSPLLPMRIGEILSVGTGPLEVGGGGNCGEYPVKAMPAMRPTDVLILVKDWTVHSGSWIDHAAERPAHFRIRYPRSSPPPYVFDSWAPVELSRKALWREFEFRDRGRVFHALVAIGRSATPAARRAVLRTLNSLQFRPPFE